jgi:hypothetical protein
MTVFIERDLVKERLIDELISFGMWIISIAISLQNMSLQIGYAIGLWHTMS